MAIKFTCPECSQELVVHYLKVGEGTKCTHCGAYVKIPEDAQSVFHDGSALSDKSPASKNSTSYAYSQHSGWIGLLKVLGWIFFIVGGLAGLLFLIVGMVESSEGNPSGPASMLLSLYLFFVALAGGIFYIAIAIIIKCLVDIRERVTDLVKK